MAAAKVLPKSANPRARKPWTVRFWDERGQHERSFATQREAKEFRAFFEHGSREHTYVDPRNGSIGFAEYATAYVATMDRAPSTLTQYRSIVRKHIAPAYAGKTLAQAAQDRETLTGLLATLRAAGYSAGRAGMVRSVVVMVLDEAVRAGRVPAHRMAGTTVRKDTAVKPATITPATSEQLAALAGGLPAHLALTVALMRGCGLRVSECLAVRLDGFRDGGTVLRVSEQVSAETGGIAPLKHRKSGEFRDVPVPSWVWSAVQAHVREHGTHDGYLFTSADGSHVRYRHHHYRFTVAAGPAGLAGLTEHGLRHMYASVLLAKGVPLTDVSAWLGHRDVNVTAQVYGHLVPSSWDRARDALESAA